MPSTQERESALFALALEKPLTERSTFLQAVCGKDNVLRQRLEALLAAHDQPDNLVPTEAAAARPTIKLDLADAPVESVGQTLGRYKLLERVGEGGCGVVYVAEQTEPVRRRVALKVIKLGMDTKQVVARFEAERQALAMTAVELRRDILGAEHYLTINSICILRHKPDANPMAIPNIIINLGAVRIAQQKYAEAETLLREGSPLAEKYWADQAYRYYAMNLLGASLAGQRNYADAEPLLLESCEGLQQRQASLPPCLNAPRRITESLERLVQLYDDWGKPTQSAEWKQKLAAFQHAAKVSDNKSKTP